MCSLNCLKFIAKRGRGGGWFVGGASQHWTWGTDPWESPAPLGHLLLARSCAGDTLGPRTAPWGNLGGFHTLVSWEEREKQRCSQPPLPMPVSLKVPRTHLDICVLVTLATHKPIFQPFKSHNEAAPRLPSKVKGTDANSPSHCLLSSLTFSASFPSLHLPLITGLLILLNAPKEGRPIETCLGT